MINGLDIPYKKQITNISSGNGLYLTKTKVGGACNQTCNKKRLLKNKM